MTNTQVVLYSAIGFAYGGTVQRFTVGMFLGSSDRGAGTPAPFISPIR